MSRDFRQNSRADFAWKNMTPITPRAHRFNYLKWKLANKKYFTEEFKLDISSPSLRCLDCGCKYNFNKSAVCPKCKSDKSFQLDKEDPWSDPVVHVAIGLFSIIVIAARPIWWNWFF
jgi:hypothetical protein